MHDVPSTPDHADSPAVGTCAADSAHLLQELERIVQSPAFRSSRRCQNLLAYAVQETLAGRAGELKERTIGIAVFGRRPDYDTSEDSSVRVTAGEVRKRLAQYYVDSGASAKTRIELPAGSYVPVFRPVQGPEAPPEALPHPVRRWAVVGAVLALAGAAALFGVRQWLSAPVAHAPGDSTLRAFWDPVLGGSGEVMVCLGGQFTYMPRPALAKRVLTRVPLDRDIETSALEPRAEDRITGSDLRGSIDEQVATGDAHASVLLGRLFGLLDRKVEFRLTYTSTLDDLRRTPAVFVGAFNNRWSLALSSGFPLSYRGDWMNGTHHIKERDSGREWRFQPAGSGNRYPVEYALVTRALRPASGRAFVQIGGFGQAATLAAGQRVTDERMLAQMVARLPEGWDRKNVQILLKVTVVNANPSEVEVVAGRVW